MAGVLMPGQLGGLHTQTAWGGAPEGLTLRSPRALQAGDRQARDGPLSSRLRLGLGHCNPLGRMTVSSSPDSESPRVGQWPRHLLIPSARELCESLLCSAELEPNKKASSEFSLPSYMHPEVVQKSPMSRVRSPGRPF